MPKKRFSAEQIVVVLLYEVRQYLEDFHYPT